MKVTNPIIQSIPDNDEGLHKLESFLNIHKTESELIRDYPTVYIHTWKNNNEFEVYVGETNDFFRRTQEHFENKNDDNVWQKNLKNNDAFLYVIAHPMFNRSLTLDIENRLMHYLSSSSSVKKIHNARGNPQNKYYPYEELDLIFKKIWKRLREQNESLFLSESEIKDSAIYKASPLHKLNPEQYYAKDKIYSKIEECLLLEKEHQLVFVQGDAGTGKTVLMSSLFFETINKSKHIVDEDKKITEPIDCAIVVNHKEQLIVYEEIAKKLDLIENDKKIVYNPTTLINLFKDRKNSPKKREKLFDIIFVDEAHLLLTQNNQSFTDNNQLDKLIEYAKVVVVMFDKKQTMNTSQYRSNEEIQRYIENAKANNSFIELHEQMRMQGSPEILKWIKDFSEKGIIEKLPKNTEKYQIKIFENPIELEKEIKKKASQKETALSRMIATYDWPYNDSKKPKNDLYWNVIIDEWKWKRPWNREISRYGSKELNKNIKGLAWAEQSQTIDEVGSTFTIQGFDLNYAGVIIGPSVTYENGRVKHLPNNSYNAKATHRRGLDDGSYIECADDFLKNELGILLTRGINGLYIYACDPELRKRLKECANL